LITTEARRQGDFRACAAGSVPLSFQSRVEGVGHSRAICVSRFGNLFAAFAIASSVIPAAIAEQLRGVAHEENPLSLMRRANVFSSQLDGEQFVTSSRKLTRNPFAELHSFNAK
jgi:hypothetical protein